MPVVHHQASITLEKSRLHHIDVNDLEEWEPDVASVIIKLYKHDFIGFVKELAQLRASLGQGPDASNLEPAAHGKMLESGTLAAGQYELQRRRRKHNVRNPASPARFHDLCSRSDHFEVQMCFCGGPLLGGGPGCY